MGYRPYTYPLAAASGYPAQKTWDGPHMGHVSATGIVLNGMPGIKRVGGMGMGGGWMGNLSRDTDNTSRYIFQWQNMENRSTLFFPLSFVLRSVTPSWIFSVASPLITTFLR